MPEEFKRYPLDEAEIAALMDAAETERERLIVTVLLESGLRIAEFAALTSQNIYYDRRIIVLSGKGGKQRQAPLGARSAELLRAWLSTRRKVGFSTHWWRKILKRVALRAGVMRPATPHTLRHAQPLDSPVLTPTGWRIIGELAVGDEVIGSDGQPTLVTGLFLQGKQPVGRLTFDDQASVECTGDHLWAVQAPAWRRWPRYPVRLQVLATSELLSGAERWQVPAVSAVQFGVQQVERLLIDPYTMGALLGNGHFGRNIVLATPVDDREVIERIEAKLPVGHTVSGHPGRYLLAGPLASFPGSNKLIQMTRDLGLYGKRAQNKSIPQCYLLASVQARTELLRGLMDTDGYAKATGSAEYTTISPRLAADVIELVRSLGGIAKLRTSPPSGAAKQLAYRILIRTPFTPFYMTRKVQRFESTKKWPLFFRVIRSFEWLGDKECVCIRVANADGLYVTQDYVLTHNSFAVEALRAGVTIRSVQKALGHSSLSVTEKYLVWTEGQVAQEFRDAEPGPGAGPAPEPS